MQFLLPESTGLTRSSFTPQIETYFFPTQIKEELSSYGENNEEGVNLLQDEGEAEPLRKRGKPSKVETLTSDKFSPDASLGSADSINIMETKTFEASVPTHTSSTVNITTTGELAPPSLQSLSTPTLVPKRKRGRPPKNNKDKTTPNSSEPGTPQSSGSPSPPQLYSPQHGTPHSGATSVYSPATLISPFELQNLLGFPGSPTHSENGEASANISPASSPTVKRGRGRPRKNPLPLPNPVEIPKVGLLEPVEKQDKRLSLPSDFQITDFVRGAFTKDFEPERSIDEIMQDLRNTFGMDTFDRRNFVWEVYEAFSIPDMLKV